jgi:hypothetical protein
MIVAIAASIAAAASMCPDKILSGYSIFKGSEVTAYANVSDQAACCALCHGDYHDECVGWEFINTTLVPNAHHNCDLMAKVGPPEKYVGRVSGIGAALPTPPPSPAPPQIGTPCNSDGDCMALWGTADWRCLERHAVKSAANNCHMHAVAGNSTCACQPSRCTTAVFDRAQTMPNSGSNTTRLLVIGDSISIGMKKDLTQLLAPHNWLLSHIPENGDNTNFGVHCVPSWVKPATNVYDVISFQFGE